MAEQTKRTAVWLTAALITACAAPVGNPTPTASSPAQSSGKVYQVYFLGGQSNMDGFGNVSELGTAWPSRVPRIPIFTGNPAMDGEPGGGLGKWAMLEPGHGYGFASNGEANTLSDRFGPELTFGLGMKRLRPSENVAIIKYTRSGASLAVDAPAGKRFGTWNSGVGDERRRNQYDHFLTTAAAALSARDIDGDGADDKLVPAGIVWMQGESDATDEGPARSYASNLKRTIDSMRAALRAGDAPIVIGKITDSGMDSDGKVMDYIEIVQAAQAAFVDADRCAAYVTEIDNYPHADDRWHYKSDGYVRMGRAFAGAMHALLERCHAQ